MIQARGVVAHPCAIEVCPIEVTGSQVMCCAHWRMVPRPVQVDVYATGRARRGTPAHKAAVARAVGWVQQTLNGRARKREEVNGVAPGWLPYRDD